MNEEAMKNLQGLLENLTKDSESAELKRQIASLEAKLANLDYYKTVNKADGTPAQTGDLGMEYRNFSSHMNAVKDSLNALVSKKIEELRSLEQTAEQAQLTGDPDAIEAARKAVEDNRELLNNLTNLYERQTSLAATAEQVQMTNDAAAIADADAAVEENQRALDELMMSLEDSADKEEYQRLMNDRAEEIRAHEEFLARAETLQAKDENGNVYLDKNGNPVVNINLYNLIADEKKLAKAKEAYANTNLGMLENFVNAMNVKVETPVTEEPVIEDVETPVTEEPVIEDVETPVTEEPVVEEVKASIIEEPVIEEVKTPVTEEPVIEDVEIPANAELISDSNEIIEEYNKMIMNGECFTDAGGNIVLGAALIKAGDTTIHTWDNDSRSLDEETLISSLTPTGRRASLNELEDLCSENIDPKLRTSLKGIIFSEKQAYYFEHPKYGKVTSMSAAVLEDGVVYVKTESGNVVDVNVNDLMSTDEVTVETMERSNRAAEMIPLNNQSTELAVAANSVDADKAKGNEGDDMSKKKERKIVKLFTEATAAQKEKAKKLLTALGLTLTGLAAAGSIFFALNKAVNGDTNNNNDTTIDNTIDDDIIEDTNTIATDDQIAPVENTDTKRTDLTADELDQFARDVIAGKYGNGQDRINRLRDALRNMGFDDSVIDDLIRKIQGEVDRRMAGRTPAATTPEEQQPSQENVDTLPPDQAYAYYPEFFEGHYDPNTGAVVKPTSVTEREVSRNESQPVISETVSVSGGGLQSVTEQVVERHEELPSGVETTTNFTESEHREPTTETPTSTGSTNAETTTTTTRETATLNPGESINGYTNTSDHAEQVEVVEETVEPDLSSILDENTLGYYDGDGNFYQNENYTGDSFTR